MSGVYWIYVQKSKSDIVFIYFFRRDFSLNDFAKDAILHKDIISNCARICFMQRYSELLRIILEKRGIKTSTDAEIFLNPDYERDLYDPFLMKDMEKACLKLFEAIKNNEKIVIYADYDCDGIPGAVILRDLFEKIGYKKICLMGHSMGGAVSILRASRDKRVNCLISIASPGEDKFRFRKKYVNTEEKRKQLDKQGYVIMEKRIGRISKKGKHMIVSGWLSLDFFFK